MILCKEKNRESNNNAHFTKVKTVIICARRFYKKKKKIYVHMYV